MLKKLVIAFMCFLPLTMVAQSFKFGTVDTQTVLTAMPEFKEAENKLMNLQKGYENEYVKLQEDIQKKYQEFQAMGDTVPETIKMRRAEEIQAMQQRIESFLQVVDQDLAQKRQEYFAPVQQKLVDAINAVGAENGFTYIFEVNGVIYKGTGNEDATPLVKAKLGLK